MREIYSVRMSTIEFDSIILLNKESLHLISVDQSESSKLFDANPKKQNLMQCDILSIHLLHVVVLRKIFYIGH